MSFLLNLLIVTLRKSAPLLLASMGGLVGDKAGVLNIGMAVSYTHLDALL